jgi:hypothetical protein
MKKYIYLTIIILPILNLYAYNIKEEYDRNKYGHSIYGTCENGDSFSALSDYDRGSWSFLLNGGRHNLKTNLYSYKKGISTICGESTFGSCRVIEYFNKEKEKKDFSLFKISYDTESLKKELCNTYNLSNIKLTNFLLPKNDLSFTMNVLGDGCSFKIIGKEKEKNNIRLKSTFNQNCSSKLDKDIFKMFPNMPQDKGSFFYYGASCKKGGSAFVNVQKDSPNVYCWGGKYSGCEVGIGVESAMRKGCGN